MIGSEAAWLQALRSRGLDVREAKAGGYRAFCPVCTLGPEIDFHSLTVGTGGELACDRGCSPEEISAAIDAIDPAQQTGVQQADVRLRLTGELLVEIGKVIDRFVILPSRSAALTVTLYVLHTWAFEAAHATPYLTIQSATKRSGKTRVEELLELLVRKPWRVASASQAAMFRKIDKERPTLLLDEVDALFGSMTETTEPIRAILNAGNRPGAAVSRVVGEGSKMRVADLSVYCPKVLAGINTARWPDTVTDRSIMIRLQRKKSWEKVERLRYRELRSSTDQLRAELARWAQEHLDTLREADPLLPESLDDRAAEAWEPLLAIAELADREHGAEWAQRARQAALKLAGERDEEDDAHGVLLLRAIRILFADVEAISTESIIRTLNADERLPFGEYRHGSGLNARKLAELLKPFDIRPRTVRINTDTPKGYRREQFIDAWERYCPPTENGGSPVPPPGNASPSATPPQPNGHGRFGHLTDPPHTPVVADRKTGENPRQHWDVADVADRSLEQGRVTLFGGSNGADADPLAERSDGGDATSERTLADVTDAEWLATFPGTVELTDAEADTP